ncbi:hypothetical protein ACFX5U_09885 [Sphingobacterium sp. SG20118]|uniref:hypothetical protein n=1 Tax=Sphingobacterium TaxID=28453 RepID=UPI0024690603|nr:hypothetical protein [Sphingobacterium faecium]MDH5826783.1 hypothetical protein [Sphingobacterium faecium]
MEYNKTNKADSSKEEVPKEKHDVGDDKPAARTVPWTMWVAVILLVIFLIYMWKR